MLWPEKASGKSSHHDLAVLEHIGDARRRAHIVLEHVEIALAGTDEINSSDMGVDLVGRLDPEHLGPVGRIEQHELGRHQSRLQDLLVVIDVIQEDVDRLDPLDATALHQRPFAAVQDAGNQVEGNQPLGRATLGIDRKGDPEAAKQLLGRRLLDDEGFDGQVVEETGKGRVGGTDLARLVAHLVKKLAGRRFGCFGPGADAHPLDTVQYRPALVLKCDLDSPFGRFHLL